MQSRGSLSTFYGKERACGGGGDGGRGIKTVSATFSKNVIVNSVKRDKQRGQLSRTKRATVTDKLTRQLSRTNEEGNCHGKIKRATVKDK